MPPCLRGRAAVGLLERLEDQVQLVLGDPDARVRHVEGEDAFRPSERLRGEADVVLDDPDAQLDLPRVRELDRIREQVLEDLLQAQLVGLEDRGEARSTPISNSSPFCSASGRNVRSA